MKLTCVFMEKGSRQKRIVLIIVGLHAWFNLYMESNIIDVYIYLCTIKMKTFLMQFD